MQHPNPANLPERLASLPERERLRWGRTAHERRSAPKRKLDWVIPGVLMRKWTTQLNGREKGGKGNLAVYCISRMERAQPSVFGPAFRRPIYTLILTEEPEESLNEKLEFFGVEHARIIEGHTLAGMEWSEKVAHVITVAQAGGYECIFIENISRSAGIVEEGGVELGRAVECFADAVQTHDLAGLFDHHHKKGRDKIENMGRGGTATSGAVDVIIDVETKGGLMSRKRKLTARGRVVSAWWERTIELTESRDDYVEVAEGDESFADVLDAHAEREQKQSEARLYDAKLLAQHPGITAAEYAKLIDKVERTARRRLDALKDHGLATVEEGEMIGGKGQAPNRYTAVIGLATSDTDIDALRVMSDVSDVSVVPQRHEEEGIALVQTSDMEGASSMTGVSVSAVDGLGPVEL